MPTFDDRNHRPLSLADNTNRLLRNCTSAMANGVRAEQALTNPPAPPDSDPDGPLPGEAVLGMKSHVPAELPDNFTDDDYDGDHAVEDRKRSAGNAREIIRVSSSLHTLGHALEDALGDFEVELARRIAQRMVDQGNYLVQLAQHETAGVK